MEHDAFRSGQFDTGFVAKYFTPEKLTPEPDITEAELAVVLGAYLLETAKPKGAQPGPNGAAVVTAKPSKWKANRLGY